MMRALHLLTLLLCLAACRSVEPDYGRPLPPGAPALIPLAPSEVPDFQVDWERRKEILPALERSIEWTRKAYAKQFFPQAGITHDRALRSLERFKELLEECESARDFQMKIELDFQVYVSAGWDGKGGGVLYTGYCTPILDGRLQPDERYRYPLYALPPDLVKGDDGTILGQETSEGLRPYPTRRAIEAGHLLNDQGLELVWLRDPIDAYIAHVNGSAFVEVGGRELVRLGYSGKNGREYSSLGKALIADGKLGADEVSLASIRRWAADNPGQVEEYLQRNDSYVFFTPIQGTPRGSLNVEVSPGRTLATDKSLFPRGAVVFVKTRLQTPSGRDRAYERFMLDQDTGGAIRTAGRADIYLGIGPDAESLAGTTRAEGQMYYLFLDE